MQINSGWNLAVSGEQLMPLGAPEGSAAAGQGRIAVDLEVPVTWFPIAQDGDRHRWMFVRLCSVLAQRPVSVNMSLVMGGVHHMPRNAPEGGIVLSYHSVGDEPNVWRIKETPIAGWYSFDANGFSGWSSLARFPQNHAPAIDRMDTHAARQRIGALRDELRKRNLSKYNQSSESFDVSRPYVYFPLQKVDDPVAEFCRLNTLEVLYRAAELADQTDTLLVVKRHPLCESIVIGQTLDDLRRKFRNVIVSNASIHRHLEGCNSVIVANSGVGMEALLYGKPVFSFAASEYELATTAVSSLDELHKAFSAVLPADDGRAARFLAYYLDHCCFSIYDISTIEQRVDHALSKISRPAGIMPHDDRKELFRAYGQVEDFRRMFTKSQAELANVQRIARQAVELADRLAAEKNEAVRPAGHAADADVMLEAATQAAITLHQAALAASIGEMVVGNTSREAFIRYAELAVKMRGNPLAEAAIDAELLRSGYASGLDPAVAHRNTTANDYQRLHDTAKGYQENNWLVDHCDIINMASPRVVVEVGCGNGRFLHEIARRVETVIGLDWARSAQMGELPANVMFRTTNVLVDNLPQGDVCCSADVLEHFEPRVLPQLLRKMHGSARINYHVIACYDDGHSHCAVLHPGQWLGLFKSIDPAYELAAVVTRPSRPDRLVCVITNLKQAPDQFPNLGRIVGTWATNTGQQVTFLNDFTVRVGGQAVATWFPMADGSAAMNWTNSKMIDLLRPAPDGRVMQINNLNGEAYEVHRVN
ncbi:capsular polysaccharide export protein, LipB/KpsS family [Rhizobium sp. LEGMi198b]|uniref:capsular polysaccharide export protein, LipB/KpsS family n=1 Tax=unclassified Rhizobium TaxID=2613769 RepID=UPI00131A5406|nr:MULTISPECIES: hypothetical protein [Rhizobium]MDK4737845.1 hypothetical protein [Rhizobium sp. CNPSo 3464]UWU22968.1 hypothetical protein N2601_08485 [Rhizobium tropici]